MFKSFSKKLASSIPNNSFGSNLFSAYDFGGCIFWLNAEDAINGKSNLDPVLDWTDRVFGVRFDAPVATPPRIVLNNALYNNNPTVESIDRTRWMVSYNGGLTLPSKYTLAVVANYGTLSQGAYFLGNEVSIYGFGMGGSSAGLNGVFSRQLNGTIETATTENSNSKISIFSSDVGIMVDKVVEYSTPLAVFNGLLNAIFNVSFQNGNLGLLGNIAEILVFNRSFDLNDCQSLSDKLNIKYSIY